MLPRELEPEVMDEPSESQAYDDMDHERVNQQFVSELLAGGDVGQRVLDLGTGTARIPIELCAHFQDCRVLASDAAVSMLEIARINVAIAGLEDRIELHLGDAKSLDFDDALFDTVISNSLLHHLPDPRPAILEMIRVVRPGGRIFVRDLMRPPSRERVEELVSTHAEREPENNRQLLRQSLVAALTREELTEMVNHPGLDKNEIEVTSDRHLTWLATRRAE